MANDDEDEGEESALDIAKEFLDDLLDFSGKGEKKKAEALQLEGGAPDGTKQLSSAAVARATQICKRYNELRVLTHTLLKARDAASYELASGKLARMLSETEEDDP